MERTQLQRNPECIEQQFIEHGYIIARNAISDELSARLRHLADSTVADIDSDHRNHFPRQGSMLQASMEDPTWRSLITDPDVLTTIANVGGDDVRWLSGYLISKPPHSPRLWWHQDWWAWQHSISLEQQPAQLSVMIYPSGSTETNGCLRVIPGSHRQPHFLHGVLPEAHTDEINHTPNNHVAYSDQPDEVNVALGPRDVAICDVRLLHSTHANESDMERPGITLWYLPNYKHLPNEFKEHYEQHPCQPDDEVRRRLSVAAASLLVPSVIVDAPQSIEIHRQPTPFIQNSIRDQQSASGR